MINQFKYAGLLTLALMAFPVIGHNKASAYAQSLSFSDQARTLQGVAVPDAGKTLTGAAPTSSIVTPPKLGNSYSDYVKNYTTWKNGLSLTDLIRGAENGETSAPMSQTHWQQQFQSDTTAAANGITIGPYPAAAPIAPTATASQYNLLVQQNKAEYEALKAKVNNVPAMIASKQCAPAGSIVAGPIPACPSTADLANLLNKNQAKEQALLAQISPAASVTQAGSTGITIGPVPASTTTAGVKCAPAGSIVAGPIPACPTGQATAVPKETTATPAVTTPTQAEYNALVSKNQADYAALQAKVNNVPAMIASKQCAPAGSIVAGPIPACPSDNDLAKLMATNKAQEQAMLAKMSGSALTVAASSAALAASSGPTMADYNSLISKNQAEYDTLKATINNVPAMIASKQCAPAGSIVAGPIPACPSDDDLVKLMAKNKAEEQAMLAQIGTASSVAATSTATSSAVKCAPAGTIVAGPVPACPTTSSVVNINPEAMAAAKCAPAGTIVAGPVPACPTSGVESAGVALKTAKIPTWATE